MVTDLTFGRTERADADSLNKRMREIALRLQALEAGRDLVAEAEARLIEAGLARINEALAPAFEAISGAAHLGALLSTTAEQVVDFGEAVPGVLTFLVPVASRLMFAPAGYLVLVSQSAEPAAMLAGTLLSYDATTGALTVAITAASGTGVHTAWHVSVGTTPADVWHPSRVDNPHAVTAEQVGAATMAQVNAAVAAIWALGGQFAAAISAPKPSPTSNAQTVANTSWVWDRLAEYVPAGIVVPYAGTVTPSGWLRGNAPVLSRTLYSRLFAAVGTLWGAGDGVTTFVGGPNTLGRFWRVLDEGAGLDPGRVPGSLQADEIRAHNHAIIYATSGTSGTNRNSVFSTGLTGNSGTTGGTETRPVNFAMPAIIRY